MCERAWTINTFIVENDLNCGAADVQEEGTAELEDNLNEPEQQVSLDPLDDTGRSTALSKEKKTPRRPK